jgi:transposase
MKTFPHTEMDRQELERLIRGRNTAQKVVLRAGIVLKMMEGVSKKRIAAELSTSRPTVYRWIVNYEKGGIRALLNDAPRSGRIPQMSQEKEKSIVNATLKTLPENATHWSIREMAKVQGVSRMAVQRVWKKYNIKPHLVKTFKLSNDPRFVEKV